MIDMDALLFSFSFVFSFIFILIGYAKESSVLEVIGSLALLMTSIFLASTNLQTTLVALPTNATLANQTVVKTVTYASETAPAVGFMFAIFAIFNLLYSGYMILYGKKGA